MRALSASELLTVWERGSGQTPVERALALLSAACAGPSPEALARLSLGRRDALLLDLREQTFGPTMASLANCPACGERLEMTFDAADLRAQPGGAEGPTGGATGEPLTLRVGDYEVSFRLPDSFDLAAAAGRSGEAEAAALILERCLVDARRGDERLTASQLPSDVGEAVARRMAEADPQAEVLLNLACPACGAGWLEPFDIESYFWGEVDAWAQRVLLEVHALASRYGWSEADILNMSAWRRRFYLNLFGG